MSSQDFTALETEIQTASREIENAESQSPFHFLGDFYSDIDSFLLNVLGGLERICVDDAMRPGNQPEDLKGHIFNELEDVRELRESLHSEDIPTELFFLLEDIKRDLNINQDIGLQPERKFLIYKINSNFWLLNRIAFWEMFDKDRTKSRVIQFPRSEFRRPINYSLLVHECFHIKEELLSDVQDKLDEVEDIPKNVQEEICVDLVSLNYVGPAYGYSMMRIPDKIGRHESLLHPNHQTRVQYIQQFLEYIEKKEVNDSSEVVQRTLGDEPDYHSVFSKSQSIVNQEVEERLNNEQEHISIDNFEKVQQYIEEIFNQHSIPTYVSERGNLKQYLGMPAGSPQKLSENLDNFLLANSGNEIALPIKPILLFNLLLSVENLEQKRLESVVLSSFKKWYVTRKTREAKGQDVIDY